MASRTMIIDGKTRTVTTVTCDASADEIEQMRLDIESQLDDNGHPLVFRHRRPVEKRLNAPKNKYLKGE